MITSPEGKTAVITGGAGGIGRAIAETCLEAGMNVVIADVSETALSAAQVELGHTDRLYAVACDIATVAGNEHLRDEALKRFGQVNLLCLNAGVARLKPLPDTTEAEWRLQVGVNLDGPFFGVQAFLPALQTQSDAHIVITASVMSLFSAPVMGPYFATKAAALSLAESLYFDLQASESHVGVSVLMPGDTRTDAMKNSIQEDTDPELAEMARADLEQGTHPRVVADAVLAAAQSGEFYVLPNIGEYQPVIDARHARIRNRLMPDAEVTEETEGATA